MSSVSWVPRGGTSTLRAGVNWSHDEHVHRVILLGKEVLCVRILPFPKAFQLVTVINWQAILSTFIQGIYHTSGEWLTNNIPLKLIVVLITGFTSLGLKKNVSET